MTLNPTFAVNEVEFNIKQETGGYASSDWLQFVRDFSAHPPAVYTADLGTPRVPVPLRSYPALPALVAQGAETNPTPDTLEDALFWNYWFIVSYEGAIQDQLVIAVDLNLGSNGEGARYKPNPDPLFNALAQYAAIEDPLWHLLDGLKNGKRGQDEIVLAGTLDTYAGLAERVTAGWAAHWDVNAGEARLRSADHGLIHPSRRCQPTSGTNPVQHQRYNYLASYEARGDSGMLEGLTLTQFEDTNSLGWPEVTLVVEDDTRIRLEGTDPLRATRTYFLPNEAQVPVLAERRLRFCFPKLHIGEVQNVSTAVSVVRNARLLGANGSETCSSFIFRTPELAFPEPLVPLIVVPGLLEMAAWQEEKGKHPFSSLLGTLFGDQLTDRDIGFSIRYGYTLAEGNPPLKTYLPVALYPRTRIDEQTVPGIITAIKTWNKDVAPLRNGGLWSFNLSFYSTVNPKLERPLLELKQLVFPVAST